MSTGSNLPKGWSNLGGRITPPSRGASTTRPRAADPAPPAPPEKDPKKDPPAAADPMKCAKCAAEIPAMEPPAKFCPSCGAPVDGAEPAPPADGEGAKAMALGRHALALTSTSSPDAARGVLEAWKGSHDQLVNTRSELAAVSMQIESIERERIIEQAVRDQVIDPALAWTFTANEKGEKARTFSAWAGPPYAGPDPKRQGEGQSIAQLKAFIAVQTAAPKAAAARPVTAAPIAGVASLTDEQMAHCKRNGLNPEIYAERLAAEQQKGNSR